MSTLRRQVLRVRPLLVVRRATRDLYGGQKSLLLALERLRSSEPYVLVAAPAADDPFGEALRARGIPHEVLVSAGAGTREVPLRSRRGIAEVAAVNVRVATLVRRLRASLVHVDMEGVFHSAPGARVIGAPLIVHVRNIPVGGRVGGIHRFSLRMATRTIFITESLRRFYLEQVPPRLSAAAGPRTRTVLNGLDFGKTDAIVASLSRSQARARAGIKPGEVAIGVVGSMEPRKRQLELLRSVLPSVVAHVPRVRAFIVGGEKDPAYARACRTTAEEMGLADRVVFAGYQTCMPQWYRAFDVLAFPSEREGFGRVVVEAQALGVPVVACDIVGVRDAVEDGVGGYLAVDLEAFTNRLTELCADAPLRAAIGERGEQWARRFDADRVTPALEAVYAEVASRA